MVVRDDGTKWACQSCLKGHRVSGCTHTDRELVLVPKKGRPTTQCQHCRQERKKRSAHVKCDCAESDKAHHPKEKCIHLREADEKAKANGFHEDHHDEKDPAHLAAVAEEQGCCCHHGGKCSCAMLMREEDSDGNPIHGKPAVQKPRLESRKSEGCITVFSNGHHKPVHRRNHAAHESGMPYKVPMSRSNTDSSTSRTARRSVDNLTLSASKHCGGNSGKSSRRNSARRMSKSEHASPKLSGATYSNSAGPFADNNFTAVDFAGLDHVQSNDTLNSAASENMFPPFDPMSGLADYAFDPWSAFPSADVNGMPNNNPFGVWPTNPDTVGLAQPALTAASSGTQSEIDEIPGMEETFEPGMPSIQEDVGSIELDGLPSNPPPANRRSLPPNFFASTDVGMNGWNNEWQAQMSAFNDAVNEPKSMDNMQSATFDNAWQMPSFPAITDTPHRPVHALPLGLSARSVTQQTTSTSTSNDDLMRSLFPEMDFNIDNTPSNPSPQTSGSGKAPAFSSQVNDAYAIPFDNYQDNDEFTSQPWADGSMIVPNDQFPSPFAFDQDFSSHDYSPSYTS